MTNPFSNSTPAGDPLISELVTATAELYSALGAIRLLTLFPFFAPGLTEVEEQLGRALNSLLEVRRQLEDETPGRQQ
jgi:hypothetical protein